MRSITLTRRTVLLSASAAVAVGGVAVGSIPSPTGVISACVKSSGAVRLIDTALGEHCGNFEKPISWNVDGRAGTPGAPGANGAKGPKGPTGPRGARGARGAAGAKGPTGQKGPKGPTGAKGATGTPGAPGAPGAQGPTGAAGAAGAAGTAGPGGASQILNLAAQTNFSLGADGARKYMAFQPVSLTRPGLVTVSASGVFGVAAGGVPATFDYGACSGPLGSGNPIFFSEADIQTLTVQPGQSVSASTTRSKTFPAGDTFAGFCVRLNAGVLDRIGRVNGVLTIY